LPIYFHSNAASAIPPIPDGNQPLLIILYFLSLWDMQQLDAQIVIKMGTIQLLQQNVLVAIRTLIMLPPIHHISPEVSLFNALNVILQTRDGNQPHSITQCFLSHSDMQPPLVQIVTRMEITPILRQIASVVTRQISMPLRCPITGFPI
jgi:hypothetical protein